MKTKQINQWLRSELILLDGATGTHLQAKGMPIGVAPEIWILENPKILQDLQTAYYEAGSQIVLTATFGANRPKLTRHLGQDIDVGAINRRLAEITISLRDGHRMAKPGQPFFVAGDIGPTGHFLYPVGDLSLDDMITIYREQVRGLLDAGVDLFVIETMMDLAEARAAVLAVKAECDLPVLASLTFAENGHTLSGNPPAACLLTLADAGVAAFGINCSFGPEELGQLVEPLRSITPIPLLLKPNAGLPVIVDGQTVFPMNPAAFAQKTWPLAGRGVQILGGCCGTGPEHIRQLSRQKAKTKDDAISTMPERDMPDLICSARQIAEIRHVKDWPVFEYRDPDSLSDDLLDALDAEAAVLSIDANLPSKDRLDLIEAIIQLQVMAPLPLVFKTDHPLILENLLHVYCGCAGYISDHPDPQTKGVRLTET